MTNLGVFQGEVGNRQDAMTLTEEAVELRRRLAAINPAMVPELAMTLGNLASGYMKVGRQQEAVTVTEEAVQIYRQLAASDLTFLPYLADTLNYLGARYTEVGRPMAVEPVWRAVLADVAPEVAARLLLARCASADAGDGQAAGWVATALPLADGNRRLTAAIREQARRHRDADSTSFDAHWTGPRPDWLTVDTHLLAVARSWVATPTLLDERDFLITHMELLGKEADSAVTEALFILEDQEAQRYDGLRTRARTEGVAAAYEPLLLGELAYEFVTADPAGQATLMTDRRDGLLTDTVRTAITELAGRSNDVRPARAHALLELAAVGDGEPGLLALAEPARFPALLEQLATGDDIAPLGPTAQLASTVAATASDRACAVFHLAVATAVSGDTDQAKTLLAQARQLDPDRTGDWKTKLVRIGQRHPVVLPLLALLTQPFDDTSGAD
ncbi:tetratricopeptide repeat protein [Polymorphospora lycopeni]|uniref:Tetratricopeptide repeat protein n=1 Tax=Polymorphospora lycopeni TaxID=3140240 RepID=A0ABV5CQH6_9ACTN